MWRNAKRWGSFEPSTIIRKEKWETSSVKESSASEGGTEGLVLKLGKEIRCGDGWGKKAAEWDYAGFRSTFCCRLLGGKGGHKTGK